MDTPECRIITGFDSPRNLKNDDQVYELSVDRFLRTAFQVPNKTARKPSHHLHRTLNLRIVKYCKAYVGDTGIQVEILYCPTESWQA